MPKKNDTLISNNIFKNKNVQERKQIFTQKMAELINQLEKSKATYT